MKSAKLFLIALIILIIACKKNTSIQITEEKYNGTEQFKIQTPSATYYLEKEAGGFSSIIDRDGNDWIKFKKTENPGVPQSAAADFRGLPNMVHRSDDKGCGHPGFNKCSSVQLDDRTIRTTSKSGKWQWTWTFFKKFAVLAIDKVDTNNVYWVLYEGPIAGKYDPGNQYWGTNKDGVRTDKPDRYLKETVYGSWHWAFFGDYRVNRVLFLAQKEDDQITDTFGFMGNSKTDALNAEDGMVVFGFGREAGATPLLTAPDNAFYIGFFEDAVTDSESFETLRLYVENILKRESSE
ncbi:hypothetical protein GF337_16845 [candidate division KSB1 bacterium]|nr:hypothetical protein [candidate division KSB1 bacterium]